MSFKRILHFRKCEKMTLKSLVCAKKTVHFCQNSQNFAGFQGGTINDDWLLQSTNKIQKLIIMAKNANITPLHDRVIVKPAPAEEKTAGGIIIPDTAKEKPQRGTVVAAGPGKKDEPMTVKSGDTILYGKYAGTEVNFEGEDYLIMRESDILAVI
jgi:chaperonin GroES